MQTQFMAPKHVYLEALLKKNVYPEAGVQAWLPGDSHLLATIAE